MAAEYAQPHRFEAGTEAEDIVLDEYSSEDLEQPNEEPGIETIDFWNEETSEKLRQARKEAESKRSADSIRSYLKRIRKIPLLNAEQEVELAKRIEAGLLAGEKLQKALENDEQLDQQLQLDLQWLKQDGKKAKNRLIEANLRLAASLAKHRSRQSMTFLDIFDEGSIGLIRAVEKFDYTKGYKFSTYATWWIRQAISRALADQARTIRIPAGVDAPINKLNRIEHELKNDLGRKPTAEELAKEMYISPERVLELQHYDREPLSFDQTIGNQEDESLGDYIEDADAMMPEDVVLFGLLQDELRSVLDTLTQREAGVIRLRFGLIDGQPRTLDEIARVYGLSRERIRQIESRTMCKLRHPARSQILRDYLE